jgi:hypothetical protein
MFPGLALGKMVPWVNKGQSSSPTDHFCNINNFSVKWSLDKHHLMMMSPCEVFWDLFCSSYGRLFGNVKTGDYEIMGRELRIWKS